MFKNNMTPNSLPERVFQVGIYLGKNAASLSDIRKYFTLEEGKSDAVSDTLTAARELDLLTESGNNYALNVSPEVFKSMDSFRLYCNSKVFSNPNDLFYRVTQEMLNLYETKEGRSYTGVSFTSGKFESYLRDRVLSMNNISQNMRGWRFWASFLGLGVITKPNKDAFVFMPNMYVNLKDAIFNSNIPSGTYTIREFLNYIEPFCDVAFPASGNMQFNLAMSNGLRCLNDLNDAKVTSENDAKETWLVNEIKTHKIQSSVSHIQIK